MSCYDGPSLRRWGDEKNMWDSFSNKVFLGPRFVIMLLLYFCFNKVFLGLLCLFCRMFIRFSQSVKGFYRILIGFSLEQTHLKHFVLMQLTSNICSFNRPSKRYRILSRIYHSKLLHVDWIRALARFEAVWLWCVCCWSSLIFVAWMTSFFPRVAWEKVKREGLHLTPKGQTSWSYGLHNDPYLKLLCEQICEHIERPWVYNHSRWK